MSTLLRQVQVQGALVDVLLREGRIAAIGCLPSDGAEVVDGHGGALLPGLHDHHLHLMAMAAADASVDVSAGLGALTDGDGWLRAVGWAGDGDRHDVDSAQAGRPVRVQHRSGALWVVNSAGAEALGLRDVRLPGIERDEHDEPTGRIWRLDGWLSEQLGRQTPDLAAVGRRLARLGITGVTDATPSLSGDTCAVLRAGVPQRLLLLGDPEGGGPVKIVLPDHDLPPYDDVVAALQRARPRPVAVHCVTRESLLLLLTALEEVGRDPGDRVEHGSLVPVEVLARMPTCVTQPGFLLSRGDDYLRDVPADDVADLYRYRSLLDAGCTVLPSSDAPYGPFDPWEVMRTARDRATGSGQVVGPDERVDAEVVLDGMLRPLGQPSLPARRLEVGGPADVVLLRTGLRAALQEPTAENVVATWINGVEQ